MEETSTHVHNWDQPVLSYSGLPVGLPLELRSRYSTSGGVGGGAQPQPPVWSGPSGKTDVADVPWDREPGWLSTPQLPPFGRFPLKTTLPVPEPSLPSASLSPKWNEPSPYHGLGDVDPEDLLERELLWKVGAQPRGAEAGADQTATASAAAPTPSSEDQHARQEQQQQGDGTAVLEDRAAGDESDAERQALARMRAKAREREIRRARRSGQLRTRQLACMLNRRVRDNVEYRVPMRTEANGNMQGHSDADAGHYADDESEGHGQLERRGRWRWWRVKRVGRRQRREPQPEAATVADAGGPEMQYLVDLAGADSDEWHIPPQRAGDGGAGLLRTE